MLMEVSFPNEQQKLAIASGHHTPQTLGPEMKKFKAPKDLPTLLYHIKPSFQAKVEKALKSVSGVYSAVIDLPDGEAEVDFDDDRITTDQLVAAVAKAGYGAKIAG